MFVKEEFVPEGNLHFIIRFSGSKMIITVIKAVGLAAMDLSGASDPYGIIKVGREEQKTSLKKNQLNPVWNEKFEFQPWQSADVVLEVFDRDIANTDDSMGEIRLGTVAELHAAHGEALKLEGVTFDEPLCAPPAANAWRPK